MSAMDTETYTATRLALHGVAELLLAGPQHRASGTIRLRVTPNGFGTVAAPDVRVAGDRLVHGDRSVPLAAASYGELAERAGLAAGGPAGVYPDGSGAVPDDPVHVDPAAAAHLAAGLAAGDAALRALDPAQTPVLWPEHFDVGVVLDRVNYGVSAGDGFEAQPYAYVGPHDFRERPERYQGSWWNAPFGAARPLQSLTGDALGEFFAAGRAAVAAGR
jgi:hypothetical protein